jgi:hypothetical protein
MANRRVRVGSSYRYSPVFFDRVHAAHNGDVELGDLVTVVDRPGCPKANTMGHCYIAKGGVFMGLVCTNSLIPEKEWMEG